MLKSLALGLTIAGLSMGSGSLAAQKAPAKAKATAAAAKPVTMEEQAPGLLAKATFPADSARKLAQAKVRGGRISKEEIRQDNGKLVYSFYMKSEGKSGVDAVNVDAMTGAVARPVHESKGEAKAERKGAAAAPAKGKKS